MNLFLELIRNNPDVLGFIVGTLIFMITLILVSRKNIGFWITLLLLIFSLFTGFFIANVGFIKELMRPKTEMSDI